MAARQMTKEEAQAALDIVSKHKGNVQRSRYYPWHSRRDNAEPG